MAYIIINGELYHHGIKGQRWGIRRYQNPDGSLTNAGRARYLGSESFHRGPTIKELQKDPDVKKRQEEVRKARKDLQAAKDEWNSATKGGHLRNDEATKNYVRANNKLIFAKEDLRDEKAKKRMEADSREKSKRRLKFEEEYKAKGMTSEEAALAAYKRERVEKALKIAAGVAVTAAVAYGASKYVENNVDRIIKADVTLSRVATSDTASVQDAFYAVFSKNKSDVNKYSGLYAKQLTEGRYGQIHKNVYEKTIRATGDLKLASRKSAMKTLQKLVDDDPKYKMDLINVLSAHGNFAEANALIDGKVTTRVYERMNQTLGSTAKNTDIAKRFYDTLSSEGYNAIKDVNDKKFSGFMTKTPLIVFNAKSKVSVDDVRRLSKSEIDAKNARAMVDIGRKAAARGLAESVAIYGGGSAAVVAASKVSRNNKEQKIVSDYKKEHPNTTLTYKEIIRNYYNH